MKKLYHEVNKPELFGPRKGGTMVLTDMLHTYICYLRIVTYIICKIIVVV